MGDGLSEREEMAQNKRIVCNIRLKDGVLDPQGVTIQHALAQLGFTDILSVRSGKVFELEFKDGGSQDLKARADEICRKLLANPVIEQFTIETK